MSTAIEEPGSTKQDLVHEFIAASGAKPTDNVTITGKENLEILIQFIRCGFSHVLCRSDHCPHITAPPADILIAPAVQGESDLIDILTRLARDLRPQGVLVTSYSGTDPVFTELALRRILRQCAFAAIKQVAGPKGVGTILCCHKQADSMRRAA
jgi:hypothetical protein